MSSEPDVLVIGAGVSGLTTAVCLAEAGAAVTIAAATPPGQTTSAAAGAIWAPHLVEAGGRATGWAGVTLARLLDLTAEPAAAVRIRAGRQATRRPETAPAWMAGLDG